VESRFGRVGIVAEQMGLETEEEQLRFAKAHLRHGVVGCRNLQMRRLSTADQYPSRSDQVGDLTSGVGMSEVENAMFA